MVIGWKCTLDSLYKLRFSVEEVSVRWLPALFLSVVAVREPLCVSACFR